MRLLWQIAELVVDAARAELDHRKLRTQVQEASMLAFEHSQKLLRARVEQLEAELKRLDDKGLASWEKPDGG